MHETPAFGETPRKVGDASGRFLQISLKKWDQYEVTPRGKMRSISESSLMLFTPGTRKSRIADVFGDFNQMVTPNNMYKLEFQEPLDFSSAL